MHKTAKQIVEDYHGSFPETYEGLLKLTGVGPYTAAASGGIAFNFPKAAVDGNVLRFITRLHGINLAIDTPECKKIVQKLADDNIDKTQVGNYNQALIEFGAIQCTAAKPNCKECLFAEECIALRTNQVQNIPFKSKKIKKRERYFHYTAAIEADTYTYIRKRSSGDIWEGLYEFPLVETNDTEKQVWAGVATKNIERQQDLEPVKHLLTHQTIYANSLIVNCKGALEVDGFEKVEIKDLKNFAFPKILHTLVKNIIESYN